MLLSLDHIRKLIATATRMADNWAGFPAGTKQEDIVRGRAVLLLSFLFIGPTIITVTMTQFSALGGPLALLSGMFAIIGIVGAVVTMHNAKSSYFSAMLFCVGLSASLGVAAYFKAGLNSPFLILLVFQPLAWGLMISARACLFLMCTLMIFLFVLSGIDYPPVVDGDYPVSVHDIRNWMLLVSVFGISLCTIGYSLMNQNVLFKFRSQKIRADEMAESADFSRRRFENFTEIAADWLFELNNDGIVDFFSGKGASEVRNAFGEVKGMHWDKVVKLEGAGRIEIFQAMRARAPYRNIKARLRSPDVADRVFEISGRPSFNARGEHCGYTGVGTDVTERVRAEESIRYLAEFDKLTGLSNRHAFSRRLEQLQAHNRDRAMALMAIDLDGFKDVNDTFGHAVGDKLLALAARRISAFLGESDYAARLGGDEFAVLLTCNGKHRCHRELAQELVRILSAPYEVKDQKIRISASIGTALFPDDARTVENLCQRADLALYAAKHAGRNCWRPFVREMEQDSIARKRIENNLRTALENEELDVHYQPFLDLESGKVLGFEALARWTDDELGPVSPAEFIPVAESMGLVCQLGQFVLSRACHDAANWPTPEDGTPLRLSVNVSACQFADEDMCKIVSDILAASGLEGSRLELEITETSLMEDTENAIQVLNALAKLGVTSAIDDFGTGYSSLSYLKRFPLGRLKIDRSFINDLMEGPLDETLVSTILALGKALNLDVIAEGVETPAQLEHLRRLGCNEGQGYLFQRPMPGTHVHRYLREGSFAGKITLPKPGISQRSVA